MGYGWLPIASLLLGLLAWILPVVNLATRNIPQKNSWCVFAMVSIGACSVSLFLQILYQVHLARIEDWSAIMDTTGALVKASAVLVIVTFLLNVITVIVYSKRGK